MDNRTFIANVVASLAWPVTALVALLLVRKILVSAGSLGDDANRV